MRRVAVAAIVATLTGVFLMPSTAGAGTGTRRAGGSVVGGVPEAVVVVGRSGEIGSWSGSGGSGGSRSGSKLSCGYFAADLSSGTPSDGVPVVNYADGPVDPQAGETYWLACTDENGQRVYAQPRTYDPADPLNNVAAAERATEEARRQLNLPLPAPVLNPPKNQLVGLRSWLWVDGGWSAGSATASVGAVSSTVTAVPVAVEWDMGDGSRTVTCRNPGTPYDVNKPPELQTSDCSYVYINSSYKEAGGVYTVTATVRYEVSWRASTGAGGNLGPVTRTTTIPVKVIEVQAVIN